eukprot:514006-Hanusia_phi.AAC.1
MLENQNKQSTSEGCEKFFCEMEDGDEEKISKQMVERVTRLEELVAALLAASDRSEILQEK